MKIGLIDVDGHNWPNLCLMKLSACHKAHGDDVEWWTPEGRYGRVYKSRVFTDTYSKDTITVDNAGEVIKGGTGYGPGPNLPDEVEHARPDYALYPQFSGTAYLDAGVIPKTAGCVTGSNWFKERGLWQDNSYEPRPGDIIYFDWDNKGSSGPQDGLADHVGIVEKVENGLVYTVEGNSGDSCRENRYAVGHYEIYGYGTPAY